MRGDKLGDSGNSFEIQMPIFRGRFGIDLLFGDQKHDLVAACTQRFRHGDAGKQMAACATTGDEDFERLGHENAGEKASIRRQKTIFHTLLKKVNKSVVSGNPQNAPRSGNFTEQRMRREKSPIQNLVFT
jgi:hypothetical protein